MKSGIINVYKEAGFTSFDVVAKLRGILHMKKIGHTGTLDPDATGVLPVCIGKATKVCELLTDKDKEYEAVMLLGKVTDTQDITGDILEEKEVTCNEADVQDMVMSFVGNIKQIPPMYSALKVNGQKLCDLARKGIEVERKARDITIRSITIEEINLPRVKFKVHCSKGTYIRTLCNDIGEKLSCGACMESLVRTRVAQFDIEQAYTLAEIEAFMSAGEIEQYILPIDQVFDTAPVITGCEEAFTKIVNGAPVADDEVIYDKSMALDENIRYRMYLLDGRFVGIYQWKDNRFILQKMFLE